MEVYLEVRSNATAIASTLTNIRDQTAITMQTVTQHLDDMEETIRDTFVDLKVEVLASTLASLERNIATRFTTVNTALAQMASPTHTAGVSNGPPPQANPTAPTNVPAPTSMDTALAESASPTGNQDAPPTNHFSGNNYVSPGVNVPRRELGVSYEGGRTSQWGF